MKPFSTNQEIMLSTKSTFSNRVFAKPDKRRNTPESLSAGDELERACWAGVVFEMLPELSFNPLASGKMHVWNIYSSDHFLLISQGTDPHPVEAIYSIDPEYFLLAKNFS